ncbi:ATP-binding protein [Yoonia litorea]|uniref:Predicted ATPase n=1 Tax=Yoonia litorea TaxID=1123755 RepID=A0A1I6MHQ1_9RHOB|nr:adenylate/guanylate cyclase domain-containing protein [Yoonia litorea]SFS15250.1 Predicted ATPase [Yoonia litorea]
MIIESEALNQSVTGEKRWVTTFMADIVGSTELTEKLGPEKTFMLVKDLLTRIASVVTEYGGRNISFAGDNTFAIFGAPVAMEQSSIQAARAAQAAMALVREAAPAYLKSHGVEPQIRIGLAGGEVLVAQMGITGEESLNALGSAVNLTARIQAAAAPGQILCSEAVRAELEGFVATDFAQQVSLKGFEGKNQLFSVGALVKDQTSLGGRMARSKTAFVGRDNQVAALREWLLDDAPTATLMCVSGPAGMGKSRLVRHVADQLEGGPSVVFAYTASEDQSAVLRPVVSLIRDAAGQTTAKNRDQLTEWIRQNLVSGATPRDALVDLLMGVASHNNNTDGYSADALREQLVTILVSLLARPDLRLVIEDTHWLDAISRQVLTQALQRAPAGSRLLVTSRTTDDLDAPAQAAISLEPLSSGEVTQLVRSALPDLANDEAIIQLLTRRCEGNPLFAEEIMRHLKTAHKESGAGTLSETSIGSIQNLIFTRFDRLSPEDKHLLKQLAVVGRLIRRDHLVWFAGTDEKADQIAEGAIENGLVERAPGTLHWRFAHVLIRDAIVASIPDMDLPAFHADAANVIQSTQVARRDDLAPALARHLDLAGKPEEAIGFYLTVARSHWRVYALDEAWAVFERIREMIAESSFRVPDHILADFIVSYCKVLDISGKYETVIDVSEQFLAALQEQSDKAALSHLLTLKAKAQSELLQWDDALETAEAALKIADEIGDDDSAARAKIAKMHLLNESFLGDFAEIQQLFAETESYANSGKDPHLALERLYVMTSCFRRTGNVPKAMATANEMLQYGESHDDRHAYAYGYWTRASVHAMLEHHDDTMSDCQESLKYSIPGTLDHFTANVFLRGTKIAIGAPETTNEELEATYESLMNSSEFAVAVLLGWYSAGLHILSGRLREGWHRLEKLEVVMENGLDRGLLAQYWLKKAELLLTIRGLLPPTVKPPRMSLSNLVFGMRLRFGAIAMVKEIISHLDQKMGYTDGFQFARLLVFQGLIDKAERRKPQARERLQRAVEIFSRCGAKFHETQTRELLAKL